MSFKNKIRISLVMEKVICNVLSCNFNTTINKGFSNKELKFIAFLSKKLSNHKTILELSTIKSWTHTAEKGAPFDFTNNEKTSKVKYLSVKTSVRKFGNVAPTAIGQASVRKFCDLFEIENSSISNVKEFVVREITRILPVLLDNTFPTRGLIIYYNQAKSKIYVCKLIKNIDFKNLSVEGYWWTHLRRSSVWKANSSTLKVIDSELKPKKYQKVLEWQFHKKVEKIFVLGGPLIHFS
jgi:hypothetical protein